MIASLGDHTIANQREGWTFSSKSLAKVASFFFLSLEILGNAIQWYHEPSDPTPLWPLPESIPQRTNGNILEQVLCNGGVILVFFWKSWEMLLNCTMNHMSAPRFGPGQAMMIGRLGVRPYS
jgi:hypothetical protein